MPSLRDPAARSAIVDRLKALEPSNERKWGRMDVGQMLCHVGDQLRMALGDIATTPRRGPFRLPPIRYLIIHVLPWPRGRAQAPPEAFTTTPSEWEADRAAVIELIERFGEAADGDLAPVNPVFGRLSGRDWAVLSYRHLDHHLRQFSA